MLKRLFGAGLAALAGVAFAAGASAQTLDKIKSRGVLVVGSKADYKPFGFRDPSGAIVGFEPDIAKDDRRQARRQARARAGGVVEPHAVPAAGQDRPHDRDHERQAGPPAGRRHHRAALLRLRRQRAGEQEGGLKSWEQLKGQKVCGIQGAWYNKPVAEKYGADFVSFKGQAEAETALMQGNCIGWVYDDTAFAERLADAKWKDFEMPLETILEEPWGVAVKLEEREGPWGTVRRQGARRLAPLGPHDRAREEVEHPGLRLPQEDERRGEGEDEDELSPCHSGAVRSAEPGTHEQARLLGA